MLPLHEETDSMPWLRTNNPAGMIFGIPERLSLAEANYAIRGGKLRNVYEPATGQNYALHTLSFFRLNHIRLYGEAGYEGYAEHSRQYNALFRPSAPSVTFADTIAGRQKGETYRLCGAAALPVTPKWSAGAAIRYAASNSAKDTDPRNKNNLNDLTLTPGLAFAAGPIRLGAAFSWQQIRETVDYTSFGTETKGGITFYPLWFYVSEPFADGTNANRDYRRTLTAATLQFHYQGKQWDIFCQPSYTSGNEKIWINLSTRQSAGETASRTHRLSGHVQYAGKRYIHRLAPDFSRSASSLYDLQQQLDENHRIYKTVLRLKRSRTGTANARLEYTLMPAGRQWQADAKISYEQRDIRFSLFPSEFRQEISRLALSAGYERRYPLLRNRLDGGIRFHYTSGCGSLPDLSTFSASATLRHNPRLMAAEYDYLTSATVGTSLHLQCTFPLAASSAALYVRAAGRLNVTPAGLHRAEGAIATGIRF